MKNKLLMCGGQGLSHINRMLALSKHLSERFDIYIVSEEKTLHNDLIVKSGLTPITYKRYNKSWNKISTNFQEFYDFESMMQVYHPYNPEYLKHSIDQERALVEDIKPDLILSDSHLNFSLISKTLGIPLISVFQEKFHKKLISKWKSPPDKRADPLFLDFYNDYADKFKLSQFGSLEEVLGGDVNLLPSFKEFGGFDEDDNTVYLGPLLQKPSGESIIQKLPGKKVYLYMGSYSEDFALKEVFKGFREKFRNQKEVSFVFAYGNNSIPSVSDPPFFEFGYLQGFSALKDCDLAVHHGGHSSCMGSIYHNKPSIVIPSNSERDWNAQRLDQFGIGKRILLEELGSLSLGLIKSMIYSTPEKIDLERHIQSQKQRIGLALKKINL